MSAQDVILGSRVSHVRELKAEIARLKEENAALRNASESLKAHFDLALLAAHDLASLPASGKLIVIDGWNRILSSTKTAKDREELFRQAYRRTEENPSDFIWIVFDGPRASSSLKGRVRVSYTGGSGPHRADRLICDYLRMARFLGKTDRIEVETDDKDFLREISKIRR